MLRATAPKNWKAALSDALLEIQNLTKIYGKSGSGLVALQDFDLAISRKRPEIITIAGESGSGKSTLANLVLGFEKPSSGSILFDGLDVGMAGRKQLRDHHRNVQAVFQDPFGSYNPFYRVQHVFETVVRNFHLASGKEQADAMIEDVLNAVGLEGSDILRKYPHQLSGGQRQRVMIARACLVRPKLIVADEPVSMVDASLRAAILDVMIKLRDENGISFLYVTHDLSTAYQVGDRIVMLYQGSVVETGEAAEVISNPKHPYVRLLVDSVPRPDPNQRWQGEIELPAEEEGRLAKATGCRFAPRCPHAVGKCRSARPPLHSVGPDGHKAACVLFEPAS